MTSTPKTRSRFLSHIRMPFRTKSSTSSLPTLMAAAPVAEDIEVPLDAMIRSQSHPTQLAVPLVSPTTHDDDSIVTVGEVRPTLWKCSLNHNTSIRSMRADVQMVNCEVTDSPPALASSSTPSSATTSPFSSPSPSRSSSSVWNQRRYASTFSKSTIITAGFAEESYTYADSSIRSSRSSQCDSDESSPLGTTQHSPLRLQHVNRANNSVLVTAPTPTTSSFREEDTERGSTLPPNVLEVLDQLRAFHDECFLDTPSDSWENFRSPTESVFELLANHDPSDASPRLLGTPVTIKGITF